jgi:arylsulfatase A-like enzyme
MRLTFAATRYYPLIMINFRISGAQRRGSKLIAIALATGWLTAGLGFSAGAAAETTAPATQSATGPNIVLIYMDDMGYTDVGCFGSTFYETPNIDKLAADGMKFTNGYAACPVCSPSRAALLSGKYPARTKLTNYIGGRQPGEPAKKYQPLQRLETAPYQMYLDLEEKTLAETLQERGYTTFMAGKWHLGRGKKYAPEQQGFEYVVTPEQAVAGLKTGKPKAGEKHGPEHRYLTDALGSATVKFIQDHHQEPFFVYLPFTAVHIPLYPRPDLLAKYEQKREKLGLDDKFTSDGKLTVRVNQSVPKYAAIVEAADQAIGRVLNALETAGVADNTVVIFTSDNGGVSTAQGWPTSNMPLRMGKGFLYEGGVRVPLIVKWPGVTKAGAVNPGVVTGTDFYPTILDMVGAPQMPGHTKDGISFAAALKGDNTTLDARDAVYWHYPHYADQGSEPGSAIRSGKWKLIKFYDGNRVELYDLEKDPSEKHNVAADNAAVKDNLLKKLQTWLDEVDAKYPTERK